MVDGLMLWRLGGMLGMGVWLLVVSLVFLSFNWFWGIGEKI